MPTSKTSLLTTVLSQLACEQGDQTIQKAYHDLPSLTTANIKRVLETLLDPIAFPEPFIFAEGLRKAYQRLSKDNVTGNVEKLLGAIGLICLTLELLKVAEQQCQGTSVPELSWPQTLLKEPAVLYWFKQIYAPEVGLATHPSNPMKQQEEANLKLAKEYWQHMDFGSLELHRVGTTSFILRCRINILVGEQLVLKCLLFPYTRIPAIADMTRTYSSRYQADILPIAARVLTSTSKWILMDLVEGSNLREFLQKYRAAEGTTPPLLRIDALTSIGRPLLATLQELSHAGFRHEDLTPSNIIVHEKPDGTVDKITLIDLGRNYLYTRHVGLEASREALFVSPEVKADQHSEETSDLYSFGMILIELADPIGVQAGIVPESLYQYAPHLARFIEDLIDTKPENRRLLFPMRDSKDPYADLCNPFEHLLKTLPSEHEMKPGKFFWVQQFLALFYPARQLKHAWDLWRMTHSSSRSVEIAKHSGWLYWWLFVSTCSVWLIFTVSVLWGARDWGLNLFPSFIAIAQTLIPGCGGTCVPLLDNLRAPGYVFGITNLPMRSIGFSIGLVQSAYYANILAGLTTRSISGPLARIAEFFLRFQTLIALPLILFGNLIQPRWWLALLIIGMPVPAMVNILCYQLATRILKKAQKVFSTVSLMEDPSLKNFGQWGIMLSVYIGALCFIWTELHFGIFHDVWTYAGLMVMIHVFTLCISKSIILAPGVRGSLSRAFTIGERLEALAQRARKNILAS
jgi:serine/threonine protein kinase